MNTEPAGVRLKRIRLEKGLSLEDVHKSTKIHLNVIKAMEEDSLINVNPVYTKGFLKIYCKFLGVDPKDYIADYKEVRSAPQFSAQGEKKRLPGLNPRPQKTLAVMRGIRRQKKTIFTALGIAVFILLIFNLGKYISARRHSAQSFTRIEQEKPVKAEKKSSPVKEQKKSQGETVSMIRLAIRARENCHIQLKSDGKTVFYGMLARGRSEIWHAKNKMELSVGNAGVVDLEVNGKPISNLGKKGQSLKNIVISKEGLETGR